MSLSSNMFLENQERLYNTAQEQLERAILPGFIGRQNSITYKLQDQILMIQTAQINLAAVRREITAAQECAAEDELKESESFVRLVAKGQNSKVTLQCLLDAYADEVRSMHAAILEEQARVINTPLMPETQKTLTAAL